MSCAAGEEVYAGGAAPCYSAVVLFVEDPVLADEVDDVGLDGEGVEEHVFLQGCVRAFLSGFGGKCLERWDGP